MSASSHPDPARTGVDRSVGGIVHDVQNWLTVALGHLSVLEGQGGPAAVSKRLAAARKALEAAVALNQRLSLSGSGEPPEVGVGVRRPVDLSMLVADCVQLLEALARPLPDVQLETNLAPVWVEADPAALQRCVVNLVTNAFDAVEERGRVVVQVKGDEHAAWLSVRDDGVGMDTTTLARCRETGFTTRGSRGTGLGLGIVDGLVARHGGEMSIESALGGGTVVRIRLDRVEAPPNPGPAPGKSGTAGPSLPRGTRESRPPNMILVEDEPAVREVLAEMCAMAGFVVEVASAASEAMRLCAECAPEVIVIDEGLPDLPGRELAKRIRQEHGSVGIVLLSGRIDAVTEAPSNTIDIACTKPVAYERLREILFEARRRHAERARDLSSPREDEAIA